MEMQEGHMKAYLCANLINCLNIFKAPTLTSGCLLTALKKTTTYHSISLGHISWSSYFVGSV